MLTLIPSWTMFTVTLEGSVRFATPKEKGFSSNYKLLTCNLQPLTDH